MVTKNDTQFDLVIVGAGPGGYVAAIRAAQLGLNTAIVEREHMGGICLNWGCMPTKTLLKSAEVYDTLKKADSYGVSAGDIGFDLPAIVKRSRDVAGRLNKGIGFLMKKNGVSVFEGSASLNAPGSLEVLDDKGAVAKLTASNIIFATGASPKAIPGMAPDGKVVWTSREAMVPETLPASLLVIGSGAIGIEFASFYNSLGTKVTIVEMLDRILPQEDADVSKEAQKIFKRKGMRFFTSAALKGLNVGADAAEAEWTDAKGKEFKESFDRVIMAVGVGANTAGLGLEEAGVTLDRGQVVTDEWCQTSVPGVYAIGDMTAPPFLAHKASHEAVICVEKIAGVEGVRPLHAGSIPGCTYSSPQIASVGMTEQQAVEAGRSVRTGRFDLSASGKAQAVGQTDGFVKTVFDTDSGELLGAHMIGAEVTEMIQGFVVARELETTEEELMHTVFAHPTLSEAMHESVLNAFDKALHM